uniref:EGF-like domain-containing protein n=1 Tax=Amphiprion ocellaris TaxID=80972 RepID=A0AAQ5X6S5_AMPOC
MFSYRFKSKSCAFILWLNCQIPTNLELFFILNWRINSCEDWFVHPLIGNVNEHGGDGSAFFALRSCHQLLHGDSGEFFSPDYLCSNPSLWCNWTIQVDAGKRINLHLEDLTPDDSCHLKKDQIHVDEPTGHLVGHKVLQKCWREAKYTSSSNTLYVVLLIGGWPSPPYRGFYGRYQAFGPPVVYNPQEGFTVRSSESEPSTSTAPPYRTVRSGRGVPHQGSRSGTAVHPAPPQLSDNSQHHELRTSTPTAIRRNVEAAEESRTHRRLEEKSADGSEQAKEEGEKRMDVMQASEQLPSPSEGSEPQHTEQSHPQPNMVEPLSDHRGIREYILTCMFVFPDVNECGTQLVLCDINADCVNRFGSYSCHCRPGFQDESRLGSGGTNCVDVKAADQSQLTSSCLPAGCSSGLSSEAKGVYVLFFLLSSLILMLLVAAGMIYRRHHQGTFLVRCHSSSSISSPDHNNNNHHHPDDGYSSPTDCDLPPPPPPVRGPREAWGQVKGHGPAVDLPLLRFSPLLPPDSYIDPQEGGKM